MISLIVARSQNGAIGRDGAIPWDVPEDLKFFQRETLGGAIIMGRNTWNSLPVKPLPRRYNIVVSSNSATADVVAPSVPAAIEQAFSQGYHRIYAIGGAAIYKEMLPLADRLLVSEMDLQVDDADTYFPNFEAVDWRLIAKSVLRQQTPACIVHEYLRTR
ncbi:MAG: dihydrofolate reductase [Roseobacter sp.]